MRTAALFTSALSLLSVANARIYGIAAPRTVAVGSTVRLEILTADYSQSVEDVAIAFGIQPAKHAVPDALGTLLSSKYLGPHESNVLGNITAYVHIPSDTPKGKTTLTASLFSLIGALLSPDTENFAVNITICAQTSSDYISSAKPE